MYRVEQFAWAPFWVDDAELHELFNDRIIRLPRASMRSAGMLVITGFPELPEAVDPFMGGRS